PCRLTSPACCRVTDSSDTAPTQGSSYRVAQVPTNGLLGNWLPHDENRTYQDVALKNCQTARTSRWDPADLARIRSVGKFVVPRAAEAYDWRDRGPNRKFWVRC